MTNDDETKEEFYYSLENTLSTIPAADKLIVLGDFNARVGSDHEAWPGTLGKFGRGRSNANGEMLLLKCSEHELAITNTFFNHPDKWYFSWKHPRSKHPTLLDYVLTRRRDMKDICSTRIMRGAECFTDHFMVRTKCNICLKPLKRKQGSKPPKKLNVGKLCNQEQRNLLETKITESLSPLPIGTTEEHWAKLKNTVYKVASEVLGKPSRRHADWFDESDEEILSLISKKNKLFHETLRNSATQATKDRFKTARAELQRKLRQMKDNWWNRKAEEIQSLADRNDSGAFFASLKEVYGPRGSSAEPVKSIDGSVLITEKGKIMERWKEHFERLLNPDSSAEDDAGDIPQMPVRNHMDKLPTMEELNLAIKQTKLGKAAGQDGIPAEVWRYGGITMRAQLLQLFCNIWSSGELPQDFKDAIIITIYKRKGDRTDCGNHRGISLLSIAGKILAKILQCRLQALAEDILPESQCGFRANRSTQDMIFTLRQLQEKSIEQRQSLYITFVDFSKAFDTVHRETLWKLLQRFGCPPTFIKVLRNFHDGMSARISAGGECSDPFTVGHGVKQGCVLAPTLFTIFLTAILNSIPSELGDLYIRTRSDGGLFNLRRLKARTKTREVLVRELLFADDAALVTSSPNGMQQLLTAFANASQRYGLSINIKKTEVLAQHPHGAMIGPARVILNGTPLVEVEKFTYLGSTVANDGSIDAEISRRIQSAASAFGKMRSKLWDRRGISLRTKMKVYRAIVIPTLLYASETWTLYRRHIKRLNLVQQRHLRQLLNISWKDHVSNIEALKRADIPSIKELLISSQLRWTGHVIRMEENRLPKIVLYGELKYGSRKVGAPFLRYKDTIKRYLTTTDELQRWEQKVHDRSAWRSVISRSKIAVRNLEIKQLEEKKARSKQRQAAGPQLQAATCDFCGRVFAARIGLISHLRHHHQ